MQQASAPPAYTANQPQMVPHQQHQVVTVQQGHAQMVSGNQTPRGNWKSIKGTGITQLVLGGLTVFMGIVSCIVKSYLFFIGHAFWCGIAFYGVAGTLGVLSGLKKSSCAAIAYMIMSIFACLASCVVMGMSASAIVVDLHTCDYYYYYNCQTGGRVAVDSLLLILALIEFVVSIVGASMTCGAVCNSSPAQQTVIHYQAQPGYVVAAQPQGTVAYAPQGQPQFVAYPIQQVAYPSQQVVAPQGTYYQGQPAHQATPQATPQAPPPEHEYQALKQ